MSYVNVLSLWIDMCVRPLSFCRRKEISSSISARSKVAMSEEAVFNVRRNAYWWAWNSELKLSWHGHSEGAAVWCAVKYINHLVGKISRRKEQVARASLKQREMTAIAETPESTFLPQRETTTRAREDPGIRVRLVNALTGEFCVMVMMTKWLVLGDAIAKANVQLDKTRKELRGEQSDGTPGDHNDRWYFVAQDEMFVRRRIFEHLGPQQKCIDIPVIKLTKEPVTTDWQPPQREARPLEVP